MVVNDYIIKYLGILIWPALAVACFWYLRKSIKGFIDRAKKFSGYGVEIETEAIKLKTEQVNFMEKSKEQSAPVLKEEEKEKQKLTDQELRRLFGKDLEFENIYNTIFGSQLRLLERLVLYKINNAGGVFHLYFESYFNGIKHKMPTVLSGWTVDIFVKFLLDTNLIEITNKDIPVYEISQKGIDFLKYLDNRGYDRDKLL